MFYNSNIHHRRTVRLQGYNYLQAGCAKLGMFVWKNCK